VVQCWPSAGTHCRSSAQIAQTSTFSLCSTAQVAQIQKLTVVPSLSFPAGSGPALPTLERKRTTA
jgi:hypothetical protein